MSYDMTYTKYRPARESPSHHRKGKPMSIYTTKQDYIAQAINPALGEYAEEFDIDQIADEMLHWHNEVEGNGDINLGRSGFVENDDKDFWTVVENNAN